MERRIKNIIVIIGIVIIKSVGEKRDLRKEVRKGWKELGKGISKGKADFISLYIYKGIVYVGYTDKGKNDKVIVKKYEGGIWKKIGKSGVSEGVANWVALYVDEGIPYIAYQDYEADYKLTVMKYEEKRRRR